MVDYAYTLTSTLRNFWSSNWRRDAKAQRRRRLARDRAVLWRETAGVGLESGSDGLQDHLNTKCVRHRGAALLIGSPGRSFENPRVQRAQQHGSADVAPTLFDEGVQRVELVHSGEALDFLWLGSLLDEPEKIVVLLDGLQ